MNSPNIFKVGLPNLVSIPCYLVDRLPYIQRAFDMKGIKYSVWYIEDSTGEESVELVCELNFLWNEFQQIVDDCLGLATLTPREDSD